MPTDKSSRALFIGDKISIAATVLDTVGDHVLVRLDEPPNREYHFQSSVVELVERGPAGLNADKVAAKAAAAAAAATPAPVETPAVPTEKDRAIAFLMEKQGFSKPTATEIVEKEGVENFLRWEEAEKRKAENLAKVPVNPMGPGEPGTLGATGTDPAANAAAAPTIATDTKAAAPANPTPATPKK